MSDEIVQAEFVETLPAKPIASEVRISKQEFNNLQANKVGWIVLLGGVGVAAALGALLLVITATEKRVGNPSCQSQCYVEF